MNTLLINEDLVSKFKFWYEGQIHTGMRFRNQLFCCHTIFESEQRHYSFSLAEKLSQDGNAVVITVADAKYTLWIDLRSKSNDSSPNAPVSLPNKSFVKTTVDAARVAVRAAIHLASNLQHNVLHQLYGTTVRFAWRKLPGDWVPS